MDRLQAMKVFIRVAEAQGFAEVARQLRMSPPGVTRAIAQLETALGTQLLIRTTRSVKMTDAGQRYYADCKRILADLAEAEATAAGAYATPTGTLCVSAPVLFGRLHVLPIITTYLDQNPATTVQALCVDRLVNLVDEGIDVAVRIGHLPDSGLHAVNVGYVRRVICAAPEYLLRAGVPLSPAALAQHQLIATMGNWSSQEWQFADARGRKQSVTIHPRLLCNNNEAAIAAATAGWGMTRVLSYQISRELAAGQLQVVLDPFEEEKLPIHILYNAGRSAPAKVRAFIDLAVSTLRALPL